MKNKNITDAWDGLVLSEETEDKIYEKIQQKLQPQKKQLIFKSLKLRPVLITAAIFIMLVTTVVATTPLILKMLGSDIGFFNSDKQTRYSADQELIKQYSSEVNVTAEKDGFSLTVDNIAFDGTFMNVFYTIKSDEINLFEEAKEYQDKYNLSYLVQHALVINEIQLEIPDYMFIKDVFGFAASDGYFVSDYELKGVRRYIITEDLPDMFDIEINYYYYWNNRGALFNIIEYPVLEPINIKLTVDMSESKIETLTLNPDIYATVIQPGYCYDIENDEYPDIVEHNITVDKVRISPLGNILVFTEEGGSSSINQELFNYYFIVDDKGNSYGKISDFVVSRKNWGENETYMVEFCGNVPSDAQYLKLIPYNYSIIITASPYDDLKKAELDSLPHKLKQSEYGNILIENCDTIDNTVSLTYKLEGMVGNNIFVLLNKEERSLSDCSFTIPIYNHTTDSYILVYTFNDSTVNTADTVKSIGIPQYDIELLEEQAIIIPLQ
ncbi:MAG: DUF4179 domain-containing protein [Oscillospiraceae bacterium]|nr:DUF4179 domain-containing protein [Oscillospiraceae bacterium]